MTERLDDWLQTEFGRDPDPSAAIAKLLPVRLASLDIEPGRLALGAMIASYDKVGRRYPLIALRLSPIQPPMQLEQVPRIWDSWFSSIEVRLLEARDDNETADTLLASLDLQDVPMAEDFNVEAELPGTWTWRSAPQPDGRVQTSGLPRGVDFDRLVTP